MTKPKVIVITGPTSSGKTNLAIKIAKKHNGEVISADSRQIYIGLDISTGKVTKEEMDGIPHHLLDIKHPNERMTVAEWRRLACSAIHDIIARGKTPIVAGGTGFYINALIQNTTLPNVPADPELREKLNKQSTKHLQDSLREKDPERYEQIDIQNRVRLIRALEVVEKLGKVPPVESRPSPYDFEMVTLLPERSKLKKKITARTKKRIAAGLVQEIRSVHNDMHVSWERLEEIGFDQKHAAKHLQGEITHEEMEEFIIRDNLRYAKRQYTWIENQILKKPEL